MDFNQFHNELKKKSEAVQKAITEKLTTEATAITLRFIDDNFRAQGWEGNTWPKSKENGTTLVDSGALRRGFNTEKRAGEVRFYNTIPYGQAHNEGFEGEVTVKAHSRARYVKNGQKRKKKSTGSVKSFKRKMNIKQRQFAPYAGHESPTLNTKIEKLFTDTLTEILTR